MALISFTSLIHSFDGRIPRRRPSLWVWSLRLFEGQSSGSLDYSSVAGREVADWLEDMNGRCTS
ncbi:hypothetical protein, partial [Paraburkholderia sediminicola]|uniref:hypothetical protein n=1 Tax=Paraburkholderia sediminicola TaxID=458836 RepID=UPI0038B81C4F